MPLPIQQLGRYRILLELASGGMATAYVAAQSGAAGFERLVVIKRVHPHLLKDRAFLDMFLDEAKLASLVRHPHVVPVIDVTETADELFLVLEYVESVSLSALVQGLAKVGRTLPPALASRIVLDVLAGLGAAHDATDHEGNPLNIVHRDVSPQNVIVGVDGASRLIDFGIAKAAGRLAHTTGDVMKGKMGYMAPEQTKQRPLDRRADLYAAGVVLYEALSGERLFAGDDAGDVLLAMLINEVPKLGESHGVPGAVDELLAIALAQDPDERFDNAAAFQVALEQALPPAPAREVKELIVELFGAALEERRVLLRKARRGELSSAAETALADPADDVRTETAHSVAGLPKRRTGVGAALALGAVAVGVLGWWGLSTWSGEPPPGDSPDDRDGAAASSPADDDENDPADSAPPVDESTVKGPSVEAGGPAPAPSASAAAEATTKTSPHAGKSTALPPPPPPPPPTSLGLHDDPYK